MQPESGELPGVPGSSLYLPLPLLRLMGTAPGALFLAQLLAWGSGDERW